MLDQEEKNGVRPQRPMALREPKARIESVLAAGPVCFWDFSQGLASKGRAAYTLRDGNGNISYAPEGLFGKRCPDMGEGRYFVLPREECPLLDFSARRSALTVIAWVKRRPKEFAECQAVAGMWNETRRQRQYCLFLDLKIWESGQQAGGHVSATGGPTEGYPYCMDAAIGATPVPMDAWHMIGFSYDGSVARAYLDGALDIRGERNPYAYGRPLFSPGGNGADFTVGGVHRGGEMGNWFTGLLGGLALFDFPLEAEALRAFAL